MEAAIDPLLAELERQIALWHGIAPPNEAGRRLAAQLVETIAAYRALRAPPPLEASPSDFASTLRALRDQPEISVP